MHLKVTPVLRVKYFGKNKKELIEKPNLLKPLIN